MFCAIHACKRLTGTRLRSRVVRGVVAVEAMRQCLLLHIRCELGNEQGMTQADVSGDERVCYWFASSPIALVFRPRMSGRFPIRAAIFSMVYLAPSNPRSVRKPCASSKGCTSLRCTFSICCTSWASKSDRACSRIGATSNPASFAARYRCAPVTISRWLFTGRTSRGDRMPLLRMLSASSSRNDWSKTLRGLV